MAFERPTIPFGISVIPVSYFCGMAEKISLSFVTIAVAGHQHPCAEAVVGP
jgi:hypothetical protein